MTARKSPGYTIGDQAVSASLTPRKRQTQKGVARAATARKATEKNAAQVQNITTARKAAQATVEQAIIDLAEGKTSNAAARKQIDEAVKSTTAKKSAPAKDAKIETAAKKLADVEKKISAAKLSERDSDNALIVERNKLIVELIKLDAGYSFIAQTRGKSSSTNRGLCRVLEGGKRV
jgi:hypothetical protein